MEKWKHLVLWVNRAHANNVQLVITPSIYGQELDLNDASRVNVLELLNKLGDMGWQLVAVGDEEWWLKKPVVR